MAGNHSAVSDSRNVLFGMANSTAETGMYNARLDIVYLRWRFPLYESGQNGSLRPINRSKS